MQLLMCIVTSQRAGVSAPERDLGRRVVLIYKPSSTYATHCEGCCSINDVIEGKRA